MSFERSTGAGYGRHVRVAWYTLLNWIVILSGMALYNGLTALALILVARRVDPAVYGQYIASYALAGFLVVLPGFGIEAWLLTQPQSDEKAAQALWWSSLRVQLPLLAIWTALMLVLSFWLPAETYPPAILWPTVFGLAFDSMSILCFASLRTRHRHWQVTLLQASSALALIGWVLLLPPSDNIVPLFAAGRAVISALVALLAGLLMMRHFRLVRAQITPVKAILRASRSFLLAVFATAVYMRADITIIALSLGPLGTGTYGPAINILQIVFLPLHAFFLFMVPVLSRSYRDARKRLFVRQGIAQGGIQVAAGLLLSPILFLSAPMLIRIIFGDEYAASTMVLRLLSPIPFLRGIIYALAALLTSAGRQGPRTRVQIAAALFNVGGGLLVVRPYGIVGVAIVYVLSELVLATGYGYLSVTVGRRVRYAEAS